MNDDRDGPPTTRRRLLASAAGALCAPWIAQPARAQGYPSRLIRLVVPNPAGGPTDAIARTVAQVFGETFKQTVIVDNKPGASGMIATDAVAKAAPDGYTLLITNQLLVQTPALYSKVPYDPLRDLVPVTDLIASPLWLAVNTAATPSRTLKEFLAQVRDNPRDANYGSVGAGSIGHLYGTRLNEAAGVSLTHIPYKGAAPLVLALLGGEVSAALVDYSTLKPHLASGKVRALAVSDVRRSTLTPEVPTFTELGYAGFESSSWIGLFAPAKTPPDVVQKLNFEAARILKLPEVAAKFRDQGFELGGATQAQFAAVVAADFTRWGELIRKAGVRLD